mgnify:CR=1 FL=1
MIYRELGKTGMRISALSLGTNRLRSCTQAEVDVITNTLLDRGVNFISTGWVYQVQDKIGNAVGHRRRDYFLSSKATSPDGKVVRERLEQGLRDLKTDYFDIFELDYINTHAALAAHLSPGGAVEELRKARDEGLVRFIGTSSHRPDVIAKLVEMDAVDTATFMMSWVQQYALTDLLPLAREKRVGTIAIRPIDHGALKPADRALAFALHSGVDVVLSGMTSLEQIDYNLAAADRAFAMAPDEVSAMLAEADALPKSGCRHCDLCKCPYELRIGFVLPLFHYRERYGLNAAGDGPTAEETDGAGMWERNRLRAVEATQHCATCGLCEPMCPYGVPIVSYVQKIAAGA